MKRMWIVGVAALALAIIAAVVIQEPPEAVADPVDQEVVSKSAIEPHIALTTSLYLNFEISMRRNVRRNKCVAPRRS